MFKNLPIKFLSLVLAIIFWFFVVSLENTFYKFPDEVPVQVFNMGQGLALATKLSGVHLSVRAQDAVTLRSLSVSDFEAYVDLRSVGVGTRNMEVFVTSKNPQISIIKVEPSEVEIALEQLKEKVVPIKAEVIGQPFKGYKVQSVQLSRDTITVSAADSILKKIGQIKAEVQLSGTEDSKTSKNVVIKIYDSAGTLMDSVKIVTDETVEAVILVTQTETQKQVSVQPKLLGIPLVGSVKNVQVEPGVIMISGSPDVINSILFIETEAVNLKDVSDSVEKTVKLNLPQGVSLAPGQKSDVRVRIEILKQEVGL